MDDHLFITGGTGFIGKQIVVKLAEKPGRSMTLLVEPGLLKPAAEWIAAKGLEPKVEAVPGDITAPGLGLEPDTAQALKDKTTGAAHLAAVYNLAMPREPGVKVNIDGTRHVLDFIEPMPNLTRFAHMSTTAISGFYEGSFAESDFDVGQRFRNNYDWSKFESEKLVRERWGRIPTMIFRPTIVVGDSQTGEIQKIDGPYYGFITIARGFHAVLHDCGEARAHIAPVDFVRDAWVAVFEQAPAKTCGKVYHLADPAPLPYNEFFDLACKRWPTYKPLVRLDPRFLGKLFSVPGVDKITGVPIEAFSYTHVPVLYGTANTDAALRKSGIRCPAVPDYIDPMIAYFRKHKRKLLRSM